MFGLKQRQGMKNRVLDSGRWTISIGSDYICDGSHRRPMLLVFYRQMATPTRSRTRMLSIPLPFVSFMTAYRFRKVGGLFVYQAYSKLARSICLPGE